MLEARRYILEHRFHQTTSDRRADESFWCRVFVANCARGRIREPGRADGLGAALT
jgi:hypothetical protein